MSFRRLPKLSPRIDKNEKIFSQKTIRFDGIRKIVFPYRHKWHMRQRFESAGIALVSHRPWRGLYRDPGLSDDARAILGGKRA